MCRGLRVIREDSEQKTHSDVTADVADAGEATLAYLLRCLKRRTELGVAHQAREPLRPTCSVQQES